MTLKQQEQKAIELSADNDKLQDCVKKLRDDSNDSNTRFKSELALTKKNSKKKLRLRDEKQEKKGRTESRWKINWKI